LIDQETQPIYTNKKIEKGLAFPTCVSVNEIVGHYSPLKSEPAHLKPGDVVKIDLGVHIDGFIAMIAHTIVIGASKDKKVTGKKADVILAAHNAMEAAVRLLKAGGTNASITKAIGQVCEGYKVNPVEGVLSHEVKKHLIDGNNVIINKETFDQKVPEHEF